MPVTAFIALGSNLGDRPANLSAAIEALRATRGIEVIRVSSFHETKPIGGPTGQGKYLNAAGEVSTSLTPEALLKELLAIETKLGRVRSEPNAPRTLDLDLLLFGDTVRANPDPILPHPRMHLRSFVLDALAEIAPQVRHPLLNVSIKRLAENLQANPPVDRPLAGLRTLVTGSTSGIGKAIAESFAAAGAWVIVHGHRSFDKAEQVTDQLRQRDVATATMLAELRDPAQVSRLAADAWSLWQGLDVLVCNAGADTLTGQAAHWSFDEKLSELWLVDVKAAIQMSRAIGERMKQQGRGLILTMGWDQAETGMEGDSGQLFAASKNAIMGFTRSLAVSLAPEVRVNCLAPGWIKTAWGENASQAWQERAVREAPLGRWGVPEDVAAAARWLASRDAQFITGQIVRINGGAVR